MNPPAPVRSRTEWIKALGKLNTAIASIAGASALPDVIYQDGVTGQMLETDAYNLANDENHSRALARCFDGLGKNGADNSMLLKSLRDLTAGGTNTYGTASELLTYLWFIDHQVPFKFQVPMDGSQILNPKGSDLDGKITWSSDVYFDVKGFGFHEALVEKLRIRLAAQIPDKWLTVGGSWDVAIETLEEILDYQEFNRLLSELQQNGAASREGLEFVLRTKSPVHVSHRVVDPYQLAHENSKYAFRYAKQFCRNAPFILFLTPHPWFGVSFNSDFSSVNSTFARSFARRTFIQHLNDSTATEFSISIGDASRLISGIAFLNTWPEARDDSPVLRLFLNPNAKHPVPDLTVDCFGLEDPQAVAIDRFMYDNY